MGFPLGEILFFRGLFATALLVPIVIAADVLKYVPLLWNASTSTSNAPASSAILASTCASVREP